MPRRWASPSSSADRLHAERRRAASQRACAAERLAVEISASEADVRRARIRVEHDLRELLVMLFKSAEHAHTDQQPALFTAGGRFFR